MSLRRGNGTVYKNATEQVLTDGHRFTLFCANMYTPLSHSTLAGIKVTACYVAKAEHHIVVPR